MTEYSINSKTCIARIIEIFAGLKNDASSAAHRHAMSYIRLQDSHEHARAAYLLGQHDLLASLLWALDGTAQRDGIDDPFVSIREIS